MGSFQYDAYRNPLAGSIADIILRKGQIGAQSAENIAAIQARATEQRGNAWAGAAQQIGQTAAALPLQIQKQREDAARNALVTTETQQRQQEMAQQAVAQKRALAGQSLLAQLHQQYGDDYETIGSKLADAGYADESAKYVESGARTADHKRTVGIAQMGAVASSFHQAKTPQDVINDMDSYAQSGVISPQQHALTMQQIQQAGPDGFESLRQRIVSNADRVLPAKVLKEGDTEVGAISGTPLVSGAPKPMNKDAALSALADPNTTPDKKAMAKQWLDADAAAQANPNEPITIKTMEGGKPVEKVMTRADALKQGVFASQPPASIQIQNQVAAQAPVSVDASRPTGAAANLPDKVTGLTPNATYQLAADYALTKTIPSQGMGSSVRAQAVRAAIPNKAAAMAAAAGVDLPTLQAEYKANSGTLSKLLPQATATANAANTATDNLDLALEQSASVPRGSAKLANRFVNWAKGELTPSTGLTKLETYIYTAAREYAKVTSGGAASAQGLTDSAAREAEKLLSSAQAPESFAAAVQAMKGDMGNVVGEQTKGIARVSSTIANFFSVANGGGPVETSTTPQPPQSTPNGPAIGERRMISGQLGEWDGKGWKAVVSR